MMQCYHIKRTAPPAVIHHGYNAANAMTFTGNPNAAARTIQLKTKNANFVVRFPGGTMGNWVHPTGNGYGMVLGEMSIGPAPASVRAIQANDSSWSGNHLARQVAFALATGANVVWVANMWTGTAAEAITSVQAFIDAGVPMVGIELANEWHLPRYSSVYIDHNDYITQAKAFRDALKAVFPTIPCAIGICPSADMKDADSGSGQSARLAAANVAFRLLDWPEAYVLHSYAAVDSAVTPYNSPAADVVCVDHRTAVADLIATFPSKPIWITEWNVGNTAAGGTDTQANHWQGMKDLFAAHPWISMETQHSLIASGENYNAIKSLAGGCTLNRIGTLAT